MPKSPEQSDPLTRACELVGRFIYHFARLEEKLDGAIAKLFKLEDVSADILTANIDFARKLYIVRSAVEAQNASPNEKWLSKEIKEAFSGIFTLNNERLIVAHSAFEANGTDGVKFDRKVAREKLVRKEIIWTTNEFEQHFDRMRSIERELDKVLRHIEPYGLSFDFSDPRNLLLLA